MRIVYIYFFNMVKERNFWKKESGDFYFSFFNVYLGESKDKSNILFTLLW